MAIARGPNKERADYLANELAQEAEDRSRRRDFWGRVMAWGGAIIIGLADIALGRRLVEHDWLITIAPLTFHLPLGARAVAAVMAPSRRANDTARCPLLGAKRTRGGRFPNVCL